MMHPHHLPLIFLLLPLLLNLVQGKIHLLALTDDSRRNIVLSKFGYNTNGTFDLTIDNFTVPTAVLAMSGDRSKDDFGLIGFTLSRGNAIADGVHSNPRVCQLQQVDQNYDALFFRFDFGARRLLVTRTGNTADLQLCKSAAECPIEGAAGEKTQLDSPTVATEAKHGGGIFGRVGSIFSGSGGGNTNDQAALEYRDYLPVTSTGGQFHFQLGIRFSERQRGLWHFLYHNCFNYRAHGYSDKVAVDFRVISVERNVGSYLSASDIPKPTLYLLMAFLFALAALTWINVLCKSDPRNVFRVHKLMAALIILKVLSLFSHGINYYFVSIYGQQREFWAVIYYITHLLKGALLFGTIILIGTGYTFFKNFLTARDKRLVLMVLPLQIVDNIAMVIMEESELGSHRRDFWVEIFIFVDMLCCMAILLPIIWSMRHLYEGARTDGKAASNLQALRLFRQFYIIVISYIYSTRITRFLFEYMLPFNLQWISEAIVEVATLLFFVLVGAKFQPQKSNPYLRLARGDGEDDVESGIALTSNGLFENVQRVQRTGVQEELNDIPGGIGGRDLSSGDSDSDSDVDGGGDARDVVLLLPKSARDPLGMGIS